MRIMKKTWINKKIYTDKLYIKSIQVCKEQIVYQYNFTVKWNNNDVSFTCVNIFDILLLKYYQFHYDY